MLEIRSSFCVFQWNVCCQTTSGIHVNGTAFSINKDTMSKRLNCTGPAFEYSYWVCRSFATLNCINWRRYHAKWITTACTTLPLSYRDENRVSIFREYPRFWQKNLTFGMMSHRSLYPLWNRIYRKWHFDKMILRDLAYFLHDF